MNSKCILALLVGVLGSAVYAGDVLATAPITPPRRFSARPGSIRSADARPLAEQTTPRKTQRKEER